jgi:phosphoglycerate kinase
MAGYKFLKETNVAGKTVVIRLDLNSNVEDGELFAGARIERHAQTLKELSEKDAKIVALAHQAWKGQPECLSLKQHAEAITEQIGKGVKLLSWDSDYLAAIKEMQPGEIILMENVRFHDSDNKEMSAEEAAGVEWVQKLSSVADLFVQNALSVCHRPQPNVIGFSKLPSFVGPVLESELSALKHFDSGEKPCVFVLGGAKPKDTISLIQTLFERGKADTICLGGVPGELFLKAKGISLGEKDKFFEEKGLNQFIEQAKQLLSEHEEKLVLPVDLAIMNDYDEREEIPVSELPKENPIYDIGTETVALFKETFKRSKLIVMNGPMGVFEKMDFEIGTKKVLGAISKSKAFSLIGGGDTGAALQQTDFSQEQFSHVSLAGHALLQYLSGKELPGLIALQK